MQKEASISRGIEITIRLIMRKSLGFEGIKGIRTSVDDVFGEDRRVAIVNFACKRK